MPLSTSDIDYLRDLVAEQSGNVVSHRQAYLLENRLSAIASKEGMSDASQLVSEVKRTRDRQLQTKIAEAITVNETSFFRDIHPFNALKQQIIPDLIKARSATRSLNVWCAACSSGQEPYSIAMTLLDEFQELKNWKVRVLATDISEEMLAKGRAGEFSQLEVNRGLPARKLIQHFDRTGTSWTAKKELRSLIEFRRMNLSEILPSIGEFDIIFIRNVLIYFDQPTKEKILHRASKLLKRDGYLFLGSSETTIGITIPFERNQIDDTICYRFEQ
jgi:chemotaxis protein methyltransferase CheR